MRGAIHPSLTRVRQGGDAVLGYDTTLAGAGRFLQLGPNFDATGDAVFNFTQPIIDSVTEDTNGTSANLAIEFSGPDSDVLLPLARPGTLGVLPARTAAAQPAATAKPTPAPTATAATPAPAAASKPPQRGGWVIQVGAYPAEGTAKERLAAVRSKASKVLTGAEGFTEPVQKSGTIYYRARFAGLDKDKAEAACKYLKKNDVECVPLKN